MAKILIIDQQPCVRELLSEELILESYQVHSVGHPDSVREDLLFSPPDLVLLGLYLDGSSAFALLDNIKRQHPNLPVIIVTAHDGYREDPRLSRADGFIIKRIRFWDELKQKIAGVLGQRQSPQGFETNKYLPAISAA
jgi:two-component system response regulator GlrR